MKYSIEDVKTKQIGIQYLQGKLDEERSKAFEEFLMEHPEELDDLSLNNVFNETTQEAYSLSRNSAGSGIFSSLWRYLTAGVVGAVATYFIMSITMVSSPSSVIEQTFMLDNVRSSTQIVPELSIDKRSNNVLLIFASAPNQVPPVNVTITDLNNGKTIFKSENIVPEELGDISILLPTSILHNELHELRVLDSKNKVVSYKFNVNKE